MAAIVPYYTADEFPVLFCLAFKGMTVWDILFGSLTVPIEVNKGRINPYLMRNIVHVSNYEHTLLVLFFKYLSL